MSPEDRALLRRIFRDGSTTFYVSSRFFPRGVCDDVEALYALVRVADDCVDVLPAQPTRLDALEAAVQRQDVPLSAEDRVVVSAFRDIAARYAFDPAWIAAFFRSMRFDLGTVRCQTLQETEEYMYGSAEVIGLMMARVMGAADEALPYAALLGRAYQYVNMIRDIGVDQGLGRAYLPADLYAAHGLAGLSAADAQAAPEAFSALVREEIARYRAWQQESVEGLRFLPFACRVAISAANAGFAETAHAIERDPLTVYTGAYKPGKARLLAYAASAIIRR